MSDSKETNPKEAVGSKKLPTNLVPSSLLVFASMAFAEGASKYGAYNWRVAGVRLSTYKAAHDRHMEKYWNGEWADPKTKVPHLASAIACLGIMVDAGLCGMVTDDRPPSLDLNYAIENAEAVIAHVMSLNVHVRPHHYDIFDTLPLAESDE